MAISAHHPILEVGDSAARFEPFRLEPGDRTVVGPRHDASLEARRPGADLADLLGVVVDVGGETKPSPDDHGADDGLEEVVSDESALALPWFRPGVGEEDPDLVEGSARKASGEVESVAVHDAQVREPRSVDLGEESGDARGVDVAGDEVGRRVG